MCMGNKRKVLTSSLSEEGGVGSFGGEGGGVGSLGGGVGSLGGGVGSRGSGGFTSKQMNEWHRQQKCVNPLFTHTHTHTHTQQTQTTFWPLLILLICVLQSLVDGLCGERHMSEEGSDHLGLLLCCQLHLRELPPRHKPSDY